MKSPWIVWSQLMRWRYSISVARYWLEKPLPRRGDTTDPPLREKKRKSVENPYGKHKTLERRFVFDEALVISLLLDNFDSTRFGPVRHSLNVIAYSNTQSATKLVETLRPKLYCLPEGKIKLFLSHPSTQCCAAVRVTYRKQQTPQLWMKGRGGGWGGGKVQV